MIAAFRPIASPELARYVKMLSHLSPAWEIDPPEWELLKPEERAVIFARDSALLSGVPLDELPPEGVYKRESKDSDEIHAFFRNDVMLAESNMYGERGTPPNPIAVNVSLCRDWPRIKWRQGNDLSADMGIPDAKRIQEILRLWTAGVMHGTKRFADAPREEKIVFAWAMHDAFLCIRPFARGNSRTARLMFQVVRTELGLHPVRWVPGDYKHLRYRLEFFKTQLFIPYMLKREFMHIV